MFSGMNERTALLVGAGIGGPVLAMFLKRLSMKVVVVESREVVAQSEGAFLGVAPNGMNVLDALGLLGPEGLPGGHTCERFEFRNNSDKNIGEIDRSRDRAQFKWPLTMVRRGELHAFLANAAKERGVEIHHGRRLTNLSLPSRAEGITAAFSDGTTLSADFLIGCDGLRSATRALILPEAPAPTFSGLLDFGGFARAPNLGLEPGVNYMVFGRRAFFGAFVTPDGEAWWFHNGPEGSPADHRARMLELHKDDPAWVTQLIKVTPNILGPWPLHELTSMPRWTEGRVALLGDAAHAMSPSAGQGASLAMEDAMVLAQCLRDVDDVPAAFQLFERLRRPRVDAIAKHAARQSNTKAPTRMGEWFRDRLLPFFLRLGSKAQTQSYAFRIDWEQRVKL